MPENRLHPRKLLNSAVAYQVEGGARVAAACRDISLGGMFVEVASPPPYGTKLRLFFMLPYLKQEVEVAVDSIVRWTKPDGMGVQFGVMGARETHALTTLLVR